MNKKWEGYTIVEVMVVLAVTSALFLSALILFQGQQGKTQFTDSMRDIQSKLQDWGNDVSTGFYPSPKAGYSCKLNTVTDKVEVSNLAAGLGSNTDCIYIGKVIQFRPGNDQVSAYTVFGKRVVDPTTGQIVSTLAEAKPIVAYNTAASVDLTENYTMRWGAQTQSIPGSCTSTSTCPTYTIALYHSLGNTPVGGTASSLFYMYQLGGNMVFTDTPDIDSCVQAVKAGCTYPATTLPQAKVCFKSATSNQFALVTLSLSGDSLNTNLAYVSSC